MKLSENNKILYVTRIIKDENHIFKKVQAQCDALCNIGFDVDIIYLNKEFKIYFNDNYKYDLNNNLGIHIYFFSKLQSIIDFEKYSIIYIRSPFVFNQISYLRFLSQANKSNCKVVIEIPTYPYFKELKSLGQKIIFFSEKLFSYFLKHYVSLILYSGNKLELIHQIKCKQLHNVLSYEKTPTANKGTNKNIIKLIAVSGCMVYHGYERIIKGLYKYYKEKPSIIVELHVVGDGPELKKYRAFTDRLKLNNHVFFYGSLYGEKLDELYNGKNIGVSCLGMHRIGLNTGSPLKTAEYASRGFPIIIGYNDLLFSRKNFVFKVDANEDPIDINEIVKWYLSGDFKSNEIRDFIIHLTSWEKQYQKIFNKTFS